MSVRIFNDWYMKGIGSGPAHLSPVSAGAGPCGGWSIDRSIISLSHISEKNLSEVVEIDHIPRKVEHSQTDCDKQYSSDFSAQHLLDERKIQQGQEECERANQ